MGGTAAAAPRAGGDAGAGVVLPAALPPLGGTAADFFLDFFPCLPMLMLMLSLHLDTRYIVVNSK